MRITRWITIVILIYTTIFLLACSTILTKTVITPAVDGLQQQTDIDLVCQGAPAYLLMLDSMLVSSPGNRELLLTACQSYSAYAATIVECGAPKQRLLSIAGKAKTYGLELLEPHLPIHKRNNIELFDKALQSVSAKNVPELFWGAYGWLAWIRSQSESPAAIVDVIYVEKIMHRLLELDETYQNGAIHLFFAALYGSRPQILGGKPAQSKIHFEKALKLSKRNFLLTQVTYAETLARLRYDKKLHDDLLQEVLNFDLANAPEFGLSNALAKTKAKQLIQDNYFAE